jgi:ATP-dependent Clp protease ATP-binding subunit ClpX
MNRSMCVCGSETRFKIAALELILTQPKNAILQQYRRLFEMEEIDLTVADDALCAIARKAIDNGNSAWALRTIMEELLLDTMFHLPALKGQVTKVVVTKEAVEGAVYPLYLYADGSAAPAHTAG